MLLGLADQMGSELSGVRGQALRNSVELTRGKNYASMPEFQEPHRRGELIVAAMMNAFLDIWLARLEKVGFLQSGKKDKSLVVEQAAQVANHLLTMAIRAIDYCPPVDLTFSDYLSALLTIDREVVPDDTKYGYREALLDNFRAYGIEQAEHAGKDGTWARFDKPLVYSRTRFDSMLRDREEVFRFIWENRGKDGLDIHKDGYVEVQSVRPCTRIGPDGFVLRETVAEYMQILTLRADELPAALKITPPELDSRVAPGAHFRRRRADLRRVRPAQVPDPQQHRGRQAAAAAARLPGRDRLLRERAGAQAGGPAGVAFRANASDAGYRVRRRPWRVHPTRLPSAATTWDSATVSC